jgi:hypothetical protein
VITKITALKKWDWELRKMDTRIFPMMAIAMMIKSTNLS